ncbi:putative cytochrome P450 [Sodiomyces alkalinus F11]|uniref:Putative cytochrome P450 n=1 Tax=Sodiomyces alkalinus (strain CBS 110278 / VKM F-3762 / F11) TaxID=1314773 RepID=A0A3N2PUI5_SODAK|nr:putative cytochrome P450 [Sodiomyces alkalinus F11]ROT38151.1 putative cytochrome P450 [Sodiomyces alkalinus F11]
MGGLVEQVLSHEKARLLAKLSWSSWAGIAALAYLAYGIGLVIYRLYFSPLAKFPGPKLAAATHWYEVWYDLFSKGTGGQFTWKVKEMHDKYGPIVRVNPDEVHIDDPEFWNEVYGASTPSKPMDKSGKFKYRFGIPDATFSTTHAELHRERRAALAPFFSKQRIRSLNPRISETTDRISHRLATEYAGSGRVLNVGDMWSSMTIDVTSELAFSRSVNCSDAPEFKSPLSVGMQTIIWAGHWNAHFKILVDLMGWIPDGILGTVLPPFKPILDFREDTRQQIKDILSGKNAKSVDAQHPTIFHDILASNLPPQELTLKRLTDEAVSLNGAGMETTKWTLTVAVFHILDQPAVQARLKAELAEAMPDSTYILPWAELEKLPYLSGVVAESLRLSYGQVQRIPRVNRLHAWKYGDWVIPPGIPVGMDAYHMHTNENVFPEAQKFKPERWLGDPRGPAGLHPLSNYLVPFGRGSRVCAGMPLAYMELYVALATLFRRHELELFETDRSDADFVLDIVMPMPRKESKGVRVIVHK